MYSDEACRDQLKMRQSCLRKRAYAPYFQTRDGEMEVAEKEARQSGHDHCSGGDGGGKTAVNDAASSNDDKQGLHPGTAFLQRLRRSPKKLLFPAWA